MILMVHPTSLVGKVQVHWETVSKKNVESNWGRHLMLTSDLPALTCTRTYAHSHTLSLLGHSSKALSLRAYTTGHGRSVHPRQTTSLPWMLRLQEACWLCCPLTMCWQNIRMWMGLGMPFSWSRAERGHRGRQLHGLNSLHHVTMRAVSRCDSYEWSSVMYSSAGTQINHHCCQTPAMENLDPRWTF